jgi:indolepyruvate ferredoxin oxidoreductase alpha subunit
VQIPIIGKQSGHFPEEFEYSPDMVEDAIRDYLSLGKRETVTVDVPELPPRPPVLCPGCPHRSSFYMMKKVFGKRTVYCNDIGCYTLGYGEPLNACDVLLCMGSSISQASGIARMTGERAIAYIGDSTFFHSGLPALVNAVKANDKITVVILDNYTTAMTGFQPSLTSSGDGPPPFSIERAVEGLGVKEVYSVDPNDEDATLEALKKAKSGAGVNVVVSHSPCVVEARRSKRGEKRPPFVIDQELCNSCSLCVRVLGCPAILVTDGQYSIDPDLCDGCELCALVCKHDAIKQTVPTRR